MNLVMSIISQSDWDYLFPIANSLYSYDSFLMAVAKFPGFCGENMTDLDSCKRELATFFAHTTHECGKESGSGSYPEWR